MRIEITSYSETSAVDLDKALGALKCFGATLDQLKEFELSMAKNEPFPFTIAGISINTNLVFTKA